ncbi:type II toxin-antitoxin system PemK/MazF family toxin [Halorhabdus rudnickae]|uniref:type II toxin-antitoxin system PemK/MazF family toxin n=1 Tax=Halorhabdus rudnickae TaxID=1775544 RepID=UPI0010842DBE|nr:type II toxin-antitoxin system PemK/MazF family toxin [Halorhabdus rudnickae]
MRFPDYGDLIHVDFTPSEDSKPGEFEDPHPAVVVQYTNPDDRAVVVAPVSSREKQSLSREVRLPGTIDGLDSDSVAILNLITAVSFEGRVRLDGDDSNSWHLGKVPPRKIEEIQAKLERLFRI